METSFKLCYRVQFYGDIGCLLISAFSTTRLSTVRICMRSNGISPRYLANGCKCVISLFCPLVIFAFGRETQCCCCARKSFQATRFSSGKLGQDKSVVSSSSCGVVDPSYRGKERKKEGEDRKLREAILGAMGNSVCVRNICDDFLMP